MLKNTIAAGIFAASSLAASGAFAATELISNGGFESSLTDWTCTGAATCSASGTPHTGSGAVHGFDNVGFAELSQTISTSTGTSYDFSFWSFASQLTGNEIWYSLDGGGMVSATTTTTYAQTLASFVASGSTAVISLFFATDSGTGTWKIDDVSVMASSAPAVPLPAGLPLALSGLAALGLLRRKSNSNAAA